MSGNMHSIPTPPMLSMAFGPISRKNNVFASSANAKSAIHIHVFELLVLYVTVTSVVSIILLILGGFHSWTALSISLLILIISIFIFKINIVIKDPRFHLGLWLVLAVALIFRCPPYLYLSGGQDEGLYISMSMQYERQGGIINTDVIRRQLNDEQKMIYDNVGNIYVEGISSLKNSTYIIPFYPLHPLWLAIFGKVLGSDHRVYSLLFFSLLSIIAFYLLASELSGNKRGAAFLTGVFLAVNPLLAFVSKMPFSEMTSLAFTSLGIYYFVRFIKSHHGEKEGPVCLVLSFLLFNCFFYTRMSAFMYIPYLCFIALTGVLYLQDKIKLKRLLIFTFSIILFHIISLLFYSNFISPLYSAWLKVYIVKSFSHHWPIKLTVGLIVFILLLIISNYISKYETFKCHIKKALDYLLPAIVLILLGIAIYGFYKLGFTTDCIDKYFGFGNHGIRDIQVTAIYNIFLYLSPPGFIVYLVLMLYSKRIQDVAFKFIALFVLLFLSYFIVFSKTVPYQYYYARYLSTEVIPFGLLLIALFTHNIIFQTQSMFIKAFNYILIAGITFYFVLFSSFQFQGIEGAKANSLTPLRERIQENDLLFFHEPYRFTYCIIGTPLKYYYNLNTLRITDLKDYSVILYFLNIMGDKYNDVYLMTPDKLTDSNLFTEVDGITYQHGFYFNGYHQHFNDNQIKPFYKSFELPFNRFLIPTTYCIWKRQYYLYQFNIARVDVSTLTCSPRPTP